MNLEFSATSARSTALRGVKIDYYVAGASADGAPPVVLLHGAGGSTKSQMGFLMPMLARGRRVVSIDLSPPVSGGRSDLSLEYLVEQLAAVIDQECADSAVDLVGYALGAVVTGTFAATRPERVRALVLVNGWVRTDARQALHCEVWATLREENSKALRSFLSYSAFSSEMLYLMPRSEVDRITGTLRIDAFTDQMMDLSGRIDISEQITRVLAPTLVIAGRNDQIVAPRHSHALFGAIENARYFEVAAGHAALNERAAEVLRAIELFISDPNRQAAGTMLDAVRP